MTYATIDEALHADHAAIGGLFETALEALGRSDPGAEEAFRRLEDKLIRHIRFEEEELFPAVRKENPRYLPFSLDSLCADHERIRDVLKAVRRRIAAREYPPARRLLEDLLAFIEGHEREEERAVHADADRLLSEEERERTLKRLSDALSGS